MFSCRQAKQELEEIASKELKRFLDHFVHTTGVEIPEALMRRTLEPGRASFRRTGDRKIVRFSELTAPPSAA